ncbi:MAG: HD domain-containing protein [Candidatus Hydrogenedentes bacterium]|nr:HD domain-containing protein [Candidatus Hydrogenedentota bacterium]
MANTRLVVLTGDQSGRTINLDASVTIGRNPDNGLHLDDLQISRKHAVIEKVARGYMLRDLGSGNGTFIGDRRILEYKLSNGDVIRLGTQQLRFEADEDETDSKDAGSQGGVRFEQAPEGRFEAASAANVYETFFQAPKANEKDEVLVATQKRLKAVYLANQIIASETNLGKLFERVIEQVFTLVPAHNGVILLKDQKTGELSTEYVRSGKDNAEVKISSTIVNRAFLQGEAVITFDASDDSRFEAGASIISQNISSAMCVPLQHQQETLGVMYVDTRGTTNAFVSSDLELVVALAGPAAIAIKNAQYVLKIQQAYEDTLIVLANAIELRDHYTVGHTWRVTNFSLEIAKELGWGAEKLNEVRMGGVLHDVGKIAVDDSILRKPARLTEEEFDKMKVHPERGAQLLQDVDFLKPLIPYCLYHHERFDGRGYPTGLGGEEIPIEGRVVAVADAFDAMTSNRPYRKGLDPEIAISEIEKGKSTQFDPFCAEALIKCYREGKIDRILQDYHKTDEKSIACPFCSTFLRIPDEAVVDDVFDCHVCHRTIRLAEQNEAYFGELVPESEVGRKTSPPVRKNE